MFLDLSKDHFPLLVNYFVILYIISDLLIFTFILYHICYLLMFSIFYIFPFFILSIYSYIFIYFRHHDCQVKTTVPVAYVYMLVSFPTLAWNCYFIGVSSIADNPSQFLLLIFIFDQ